MTNYHGSKYNDIKYIGPTTRSFPRSMAEAFPDKIENAQWWFPPESNPTGLGVIAGILTWVAIALIYWRFG